MKKNLIHAFILLVIVTMLTTSALAVNNGDVSGNSVSVIQASRYINTCETLITANSGGEIAINCAVTGTGTMDTIGVETLNIQKYSSGSWITVKSYNSLYEYDSVQASVSATYIGAVGSQYRVVAKFYVANSSGSDSRTMTTSSVTAKS
jgi:hypothetical protein